MSSLSFTGNKGSEQVCMIMNLVAHEKKRKIFNEKWNGDGEYGLQIYSQNNGFIFNVPLITTLKLLQIMFPVVCDFYQLLKCLYSIHQSVHIYPP